MSKVALVSMPFGPLLYPSIGLSLLKAALTREGIASRIHYFTINYAEIVGSRFYQGISSGMRPSLRHLAGEWMFNEALSGVDEANDRDYVEQNLSRKPGKTGSSRRAMSGKTIDSLFKARAAIDSFLDSCTAKIVEESPRIVGFTSVFQQQTGSLALAMRIKKALPDCFIVIGGANCEGVMGAETLRQFPFVDATVSGEGDLIFAEIVRRVLSGESVAALPGVRTRETIAAEFASGHFSNAPTVHRMDELPYPDYDDFFEQFAASRFARYWQPGIFFESSRGCWWGEKSHCTFCGLNGTTMAFRSKSAPRALEELLHLTTRYQGSDVEVTDNILDLAYFKDFVPELARLGTEFGLFYETKANLKKQQVRLLRDAGIRNIQPGIESLSDEVLKLMRKGVSALQNIQLLKWCKELGVEPRWNILWGFPGEPPEEYARMAKVVPLITHLRPPGFFSTIRLDRFSPNFFDGERLGFSNIEPLDAYRYVYRGVPPEGIRNLAYHFSFGYRVPQDLDSYAQPLARALSEWQRMAGQSDLFSIDTGDHLIVWDLRPIAVSSLTVLAGDARLLYLAADAITDVRRLSADLVSLGGKEKSVEDIEDALGPMIERGLILRDGSRYLALAVPLGEYLPARPVTEQFYRLIRHIGEPAPGGIAVPWMHEGGSPKRSPSPIPKRPLTVSRFTVEGNHVVIH